jgi:hypothetical protein
VTPVPTRTLPIVSRIAAALLGGYAFVWGFTTLGVILGMRLGAAFGDALTATGLLAFLVFLGVFLWSFVARSVMRVWLVLAGGGVLMTGLAWALG